MKPSKLSIIANFTFQTLLLFASTTLSTNNNSKIFRAYIGAEFKNVTFSDVPIYPGVEFHFILSFAIDYGTNMSSPSPTNGKFNMFWDTDNLNPSQISDIKNKHPNVKIALSLGGDSIGNEYAYFNPSSIESWLSNAFTSLTSIIQEYHIDGIDIDYEHFKGGPDIFATCIGGLISRLKTKRVISFASIAPYDDEPVQIRYLALWKSYGHLIDYVNFQFYAYDNGTSVSKFMDYFATQSLNYEGGKVLVSFISDGGGGLAPDKGFFKACKKLKRQDDLHGIFVWCADDSKALGFKNEKKSQHLLASSH